MSPSAYCAADRRKPHPGLEVAQLLAQLVDVLGVVVVGRLELSLQRRRFGNQIVVGGLQFFDGFDQSGVNLA